MKKTLLAMAVGAAALLPLTAQAAPELYGHLNVSLNNVGWAEAASTGPTANKSTFGPSSARWNVNSIQNWVGIRGEVPLYNQNLKAIYQVEEGVDLTGTKEAFSSRNTFAGLAGDNWGKLFLGNYDGVVKKAEGKVDQFNHTEADMALYIGGQNRYSHTINYQSPSFGGLTFNAQLIPGQGKTDLSSSAGEAENGLADGYGASVQFKQDTMWANLAYEKGAETFLNNTILLNSLTGGGFPFPISSIPSNLLCPLAAIGGGGIPLCQDLTISTLRLTAGVDIGNISLALLAQQRDADLSASSGTIDTESKQDYMVSGSFALTDRVKLKAQVAQAAGYFITKDDDRKIQSYTVGADYALGKNVTTYWLYSANSIDGKAAPGADDDKSEYNVASVGLTLKF